MKNNSGIFKDKEKDRRSNQRISLPVTISDVIIHVASYADTQMRPKPGGGVAVVCIILIWHSDKYMYWISLLQVNYQTSSQRGPLAQFLTLKPLCPMNCGRYPETLLLLRDHRQA